VCAAQQRARRGAGAQDRRWTVVEFLQRLRKTYTVSSRPGHRSSPHLLPRIETPWTERELGVVGRLLDRERGG